MIAFTWKKPELFARVGVPTSERSEPQRLILNITLWPKIAELYDDIENTVNYSVVAERVKEFVRRHDYKLIETLAEETAAHLLAQFNLRKVEVEVRKFVLFPRRKLCFSDEHHQREAT